MLALVNESGQDIADRYPWVSLQKEATFTSLAAESQGDINGDILAPTAGFKYIINDTVWDRTQQYTPAGSVTPKRWALDKAAVTTGAYSVYRLRGTELLMTPTPPAGHDMAFDYLTENWVTNDAGDEFRDMLEEDDDVPLIDSRLLTLDSVWRWKASKGLSYAEDFNKAERAIADAIARDGTKPSASLEGEESGNFEPFVLVPRMNWNIP